MIELEKLYPKLKEVGDGFARNLVRTSKNSSCTNKPIFGEYSPGAYYLGYWLGYCQVYQHHSYARTKGVKT
jgi:hypothetical protein